MGLSARHIAPIFPVRDLDAALAFYQRLGFAVRPYFGGGYGFASRDGIALHLRPGVKEVFMAASVAKARQGRAVAPRVY